MIEIYRGDSKRIELAFQNDDGTVLNISGATVYFTVKRNYSDADDDAVMDIQNSSHDVAISGLTHITITTGDSAQCPGDYVAGFQLKDISNNITTFNVEGLSILPSFRNSF